jgi:hypothetical protein
MYHRAKNQMAFMRLVKDGDFKKVEKLSLAQKSPLVRITVMPAHSQLIYLRVSRTLHNCDTGLSFPHQLSHQFRGREIDDPQVQEERLGWHVLGSVSRQDDPRQL